MTVEIEKLVALADRYDAFLIDQFGVLLNGTGAYDYAPAALSRLADTGAKILLLSNSGKRSTPNEARLTRLGFSRDSYIGVLSSGETAFAILRRRIGETIKPGTPVWAHARDEDISHIAGLALDPVDDPAEAGLILIAGAQPWRYTRDDYARMLLPAAKAGVPAMCTNPDITMLTETGLQPGPGTIAQAYAEMSGPVEWIGKPYPAIYREALRLLGDLDPRRVLCIGDSPAHDIAGAKTAGMAAALVRTGIHAENSLDELYSLCGEAGAMPDFVLRKFDF